MKKDKNLEEYNAKTARGMMIALFFLVCILVGRISYQIGEYHGIDHGIDVGFNDTISRTVDFAYHTQNAELTFKSDNGTLKMYTSDGCLALINDMINNGTLQVQQPQDEPTPHYLDKFPNGIQNYSGKWG